MNTISKTALGGVLLTLSVAAWGAHHETPNEKLAMAWVKAGHTGKAETMAMVEQNMADDGIFIQPRYVGFGFDPQNDEEMVVVNVTPGSPASEVLQVGDVFVSANGIPATRENRDRMSFRGKPGEPVKAVIRRGDETIPIEVRRGIIAARTPKAVVLENMARADAEPGRWPRAGSSRS